jgi:hypothetical protein
MFRHLIPRLATSFHVVAHSDYPGFGQSSMPNHKDFDYTFENLTMSWNNGRKLDSPITHFT